METVVIQSNTTQENEKKVVQAMRLLDEAGYLRWKTNPKDSTELYANVTFTKKESHGTQ